MSVPIMLRGLLAVLCITAGKAVAVAAHDQHAPARLHLGAHHLPQGFGIEMCGSVVRCVDAALRHSGLQQGCHRARAGGKAAGAGRASG